MALLEKTKNKIQKKVQDRTNVVLSKVNAVNTALNDYPVLFETYYNKLAEGGLFSFNFFFQLLKLIGVTEEELIDWLVSLLSDKNGKGILSAIEIAVKAILMANFKNLFTCDMGPFIPDKLMDSNYGIDLNLSSLDIYGLLKKCPTDTEEKVITIGKGSSFGFETATAQTMGTSMFYFDTEQYSPKTVKKSCDFNAFLWYTVHKSPEFAHVWDNRVEYYGKDEGFNDEKFKNAFFETVGDKSTLYFNYNGKQYKKKDILFCQYRELSPNNIAGTNTLKVWLNPYRYKNTTTILKGAFDPLLPKNKVKNSEIVQEGVLIKKWKKYKKKYSISEMASNVKVANKASFLEEKIGENINVNDFLAIVSDDVYSDHKANLLNDIQNGKITDFEVYICIEDALKEDWETIKIKTKEEKDRITDAYKGTVVELNKGLSFNKTIFEFNYDFLNSIKLLETKSLVATIMHNILEFSTNINLSLKLTPEEEMISQIIKNYVSEVLNEEESNGSNDDYFQFSNEVYETMLEETLLKYNGKYHLTDEESYTALDNGPIMAAVRKIGLANSEEEQRESIKNAIKELSSSDYSYSDTKIKVSVNDNDILKTFNIFNVFITETVTQIIMQALSPKVYFLYMVNSIVMGDIEYIWDESQRGKDDIVFKSKEDFIRNIKNLLNNIIRQVKDIILRELYNTAITYLKDMIKQYILLLAKEKIKDYKELLKNLLALIGGNEAVGAYRAIMATYENARQLLNSYGDNKDRNMPIDNVTYPDIVPEKTDPESK